MMEKVKLALNYALMLEMMKAKGLDNATIIALLNEADEEVLESIDEGIPTWKTLIDYYRINKDKCQRAIIEGYEITFLTKGALKSLLRIKFGMKEGVDFIDTGEFLDQVNITDENLEALHGVISKNWTIVLEKTIKIELTHKPVFNI
ncbi:hypothetical protein [Neobacillus sp. FSL H8-0543]|uniref:hypothetical protein n=1 Tax=Neobacillus sp. FSL H8-0543 TaxID=2954672 RepID=UPI0031582B56